MKSVIVIAPHPDDETLGCGGTLLRHKTEGDTIHWLIVTEMLEPNGFSTDQVQLRKAEIDRVTKAYPFDSVHSLGFPTTRLDQVGIGEIIAGISSVFQRVQPNILYLPYRSDVHTDHKLVFDAAAACTKWFRYRHVNRVLAYETLSETDFVIDPNNNGFKPNVFVDIEPYLVKKIEISKTYESEMGDFPFPRSEEAIRALASLRGASSGSNAAEAFMLLKEIV